MNLRDFEHAEPEPGRIYELSRGVITVTDVPNRRHLALVYAIRRQLQAHDLASPGQIHTIAAGSECKILLSDLESERHPDIAVYKTAPPVDQDFWAMWIPEVVVEVVSPGSEHRDYVEKREEYLAFGIAEYWIVDGDKREILILKRSRGKWSEQVTRPPQTYVTRLLPGFTLATAPVFEAGDAVP